MVEAVAVRDPLQRSHYFRDEKTLPNSISGLGNPNSGGAAAQGNIYLANQTGGGREYCGEIDRESDLLGRADQRVLRGSTSGNVGEPGGQGFALLE